MCKKSKREGPVLLERLQVLGGSMLCSSDGSASQHEEEQQILQQVLQAESVHNEFISLPCCQASHKRMQQCHSAG